MMVMLLINRSVWGCWCWHTSQPAHYQRQELPLQETGACQSVVTPGTFHHSSSSHINIFYNKLRGPRTGEGSYLERESDGRSDRKQECPKLRFRRKGCTYKYECKEECVEKKDCKTTYQYKCKEYRKQVTYNGAFQSQGENMEISAQCDYRNLQLLTRLFIKTTFSPVFHQDNFQNNICHILYYINYHAPWSWKKTQQIIICSNPGCHIVGVQRCVAEPVSR